MKYRVVNMQHPGIQKESDVKWAESLLQTRHCDLDIYLHKNTCNFYRPKMISDNVIWFNLICKLT